MTVEDMNLFNLDCYACSERVLEQARKRLISFNNFEWLRLLLIVYNGNTELVLTE